MSDDEVYDLDAERAARAETLGEPKTVRFGGEDFTLPPEMPFEAVRMATDDDSDGYFIALLGEEQWERFRAHKPTLSDMTALDKMLSRMYGLDSKDDDGEPVPLASRSSRRKSSRGSGRK